VRRVRIETDRPVPSEVDGDLGPFAPLDIAVAPHGIKLIVPPVPTGWGLWPWRVGDYL